MSIVKECTNILTIARQYNDCELNQKILDLSQYIFDLIEQNNELVTENEKLKRLRDIQDDIVYYSSPFLTLKSEEKPIKYCAACWADKNVLVPLQSLGGGNYKCVLCKSKIWETEE